MPLAQRVAHRVAERVLFRRQKRGGQVADRIRAVCANHCSRSRLLLAMTDHTQPVGLGSPASLHAPLAGPDGNSW